MPAAKGNNMFQARQTTIWHSVPISISQYSANKQPLLGAFICDFAVFTEPNVSKMKSKINWALIYHKTSLSAELL
jgi:hypothetical protein